MNHALLSMQMGICAENHAGCAKCYQQTVICSNVILWYTNGILSDFLQASTTIFNSEIQVEGSNVKRLISLTHYQQRTTSCPDHHENSPFVHTLSIRPHRSRCLGLSALLLSFSTRRVHGFFTPLSKHLLDSTTWDKLAACVSRKQALKNLFHCWVWCWIQWLFKLRYLFFLARLLNRSYKKRNKTTWTLFCFRRSAIIRARSDFHFALCYMDSCYFLQHNDVRRFVIWPEP